MPGAAQPLPQIWQFCKFIQSHCPCVVTGVEVVLSHFLVWTVWGREKRIVSESVFVAENIPVRALMQVELNVAFFCFITFVYQLCKSFPPRTPHHDLNHRSSKFWNNLCVQRLYEFEFRGVTFRLPWAQPSLRRFKTLLRCSSLVTPIFGGFCTKELRVDLGRRV